MAVLLLIVAGIATALAFNAVQFGIPARLLVAAMLAAGLIAVAFWLPEQGTWLALGFLVCVALIRRLLLSVSPWTSFDPLLLVGPLFSAFVVGRLALEKRDLLLQSMLSRLLALLLLLTVLEAANPWGGGLMAGIAVVFVLGAPLLWFWIGAGLKNLRIEPVLRLVLVASVVVSVYGLAQSTLGLPPWDTAWLSTAGYTALHVGNMIRPFGTFSSNAEYAAFISVAVVLAISGAFDVYRWRIELIALGLLLSVAIFMSSTREVVVTAFVAVATIAILRFRNDARAMGIVLGSIAGLGIVFWLAGPLVEGVANASGNDLLTHEVGGLLHPLDPTQSTLMLHWSRIGTGLQAAIQHPLGSGIVLTTLGASKLGGSASATDLDVGNVFVSLGLIGGVVYLAILLLSLGMAISTYRRTHHPAVLSVSGVLIVTLGQWLNGGEYALAPLVWLLLGWLSQQHASLNGDTV